jgi:hypothetical protein
MKVKTVSGKRNATGSGDTVFGITMAASHTSLRQEFCGSN